MQVLHAHHTAEDSGLWPLVRQRNPAAKQLLDAMEADHRAVVPAMQALTAAARQYRSTDNDDPRLKLVRALDWLTGVLEPHLDREVRDAMPVVAQALTARDLGAWNQTYNIKPKSPWQLGLDGQWLLDEIDPEGYQVVVQQGCRRCRGSSCCTGSPGPTADAGAPGGAPTRRMGTPPLPGDCPSRAGRTGDLPDTAPPPPGG